MEQMPLKDIRVYMTCGRSMQFTLDEYEIRAVLEKLNTCEADGMLSIDARNVKSIINIRNISFISVEESTND